MKKFYDKYSWLIILLLLALVVFTCSKNSEPKPITPIDLKPEIKAQDSFRTIIKYIEKERIKEVVKWQKTKEKALSDTTPTYTEVVHIIHACDTVIRIDSLEISALKNLTRIQDIISIKKDAIIQQKTDSIHDLNKKLKWQKRFTKGAFITGLLGGGLLGTKISQ